MSFQNFDSLAGVGLDFTDEVEIATEAAPARRFTVYGGAAPPPPPPPAHLHLLYEMQPDRSSMTTAERALHSNPHVISSRGFDRGMGDAITFQSGIARMNDDIGVGVDGMNSVSERNYSQPNGELVIPASPQMHQHVPASGPFQCGWAGCNFRGRFAQKSSLWRHIQTKHIPHDWHLCAVCRRAFNRRDKVMEHIRTAHGLNRSF
ncbi:hypothetical protein N7509_004389 [Penicillium cosmopolitanum]|uniref:C2H2-type domain-containing protein n=1 Tax=Penicillium cosmopolitanum TaxID=1131564 RepID=A0A9X0BCD4_9EURO|nr:uncharacterized protein N7509_004389 [Penicillium cosmopolitanum]KAJ5404518.1 hypothetical protein N7509_004389 [Penicillium cosmopolitanum]